MDLDPLAVVRRRMREQGLVGEGFATPAEAVASLGAVQAQEFGEALWSVAERVPGATVADVAAAFERGEILRTHALRPTWHFLAPADIRWVLALTAPRVHRAAGHSRRREGLGEAVLIRSREVIEEALADGEPRTRSELGEVLTDAGVDGAQGVRLAHILMNAELEAVVCSGPRKGKQHTYALLSDRAPDAPELEGDEALAELTRRYFNSHGPATVRDFSWWSGLTMAQARCGLALVDHELVCEAEWYAPAYPAPGPGRGGCHLIPWFDELSVAYRDLRMVLRGGKATGELLERAILIDGECVGTWKLRSQTLRATPFSPLSAADHSSLEEAATRFGARLELVSPGG